MVKPIRDEGLRSTLDPDQPYAFFAEQEADGFGNVVEVANGLNEWVSTGKAFAYQVMWYRYRHHKLWFWRWMLEYMFYLMVEASHVTYNL